jgi:putative transcriptional regulator
LRKEKIILKNKIEEFRRLNNEKQEELANIVGVSRQTIISIEKGVYNPSIKLAFKIAKHYGKLIEGIFIYEEEIENEKK